ncbi:LCP family protein [Aquihabitans sp. McL0605]|uniref:LCP family protein n=1 Tax=Aquihabitans sp. McL0605 TaxID=3415671 RepID=UPI003CF528E0
MSKRTRPRRPHRTWPQRTLIIFNVICISAALFGAGSLAYAKRKVNQIERVELAGPGFVSGDDVGSDEPRNFLIVGADSDDGLKAGDAATAGREKVTGIRSDTIMVVRIDPKTNQAKVLSFPRDLWVDIPGNSKSRINASLQFGGADLLIATIKANFGIDINHYVQVDFAGFQSLVKLLGGVPVYFATPVKDQGGLNVQNAGCTTLDENGALQYVRARHLRYQNAAGKWVSDPTSDLGRISRQQDFIKRVLKGAIKKGARNPTALASLVNVAVENIKLDQATTAGDLISLGRAFKNFDPNSLQTFSLPVVGVVKGGAQVLELQAGAAEPTLALFRGTGTTATEDGISPATVSVQVINGSGTLNQAASASDLLATVGFKMGAPGSSAGVLRTEVRYTPGQEAQAALVARHLMADPVLVPDMDVSEITVVTGPDFATVLLDPRPASDFPAPTTTTTTTAPSATTVPGSSSTGATTPPATTTTTEVTGFVPDAAPAGVSCG